MVDGQTFTDQMSLGKHLVHAYKLRSVMDITSCRRAIGRNVDLASPNEYEDEQNGNQQAPKREEQFVPARRTSSIWCSCGPISRRSNGPEFWRSLEELAGKPDFREMMHREFPKGASEWVDAVSRRGFLKLMGSSLALAGMTACTRQPFEPIVPYVQQPEGLVPGQPMFYATAFTLGGYATPLLVTSREFRPIKIEGNDRHPASQGGTDVYAQASILDLYDPDRSQNMTYLGDISSWSDCCSRRLARAAERAEGNAGRGDSHSVAGLFVADACRPDAAVAQKNFPQAKWHFYEPVNRDNVYAGAQMAFGQPVETTYKLDAADVIVSLDADFLYAGFPGMTRYARDFAKRRDPDSGT